MSEPPPYPTTVSLGVSPTSRQGVVIACYSNNYSRMMTWDMPTLKPTGFQDLKAVSWLLDISEDGQLCAYFASSRRKRIEYVAVSKPPYFKALFITSAESDGLLGARFEGDEFHFRRNRFRGDKAFEPADQITDCGPFKPVEHEISLIERVISFTWPIFTIPEPSLPSIFSLSNPRCGVQRSWKGSNVQAVDTFGRTIFSDFQFVYANGEPFIDLKRQPFTEVVPPEWATHW